LPGSPCGVPCWLSCRRSQEVVARLRCMHECVCSLPGAVHTSGLPHPLSCACMLLLLPLLNPASLPACLPACLQGVR
jgi:hypothetical protein